jgi:catechol 2,3-dioxygenase
MAHAPQAAGAQRELPRDVQIPTLHHVGLRTARLDEMITWYELAIGAHANARFGNVAVISNDRANHRLALSSYGVADDPERSSHVGLHHIAFEYAGLEGLLATYVRLKAHAILPHVTVNHGPTTSFYYLDPDGNSIELQSDNFGDWDASTRFAQGPEFAANRLGLFVDPDRMVELWEEGVSVEELNRRSYAGEFPPRPDQIQDLQLPPMDEAQTRALYARGYADGVTP